MLPSHYPTCTCMDATCLPLMGPGSQSFLQPPRLCGPLAGRLGKAILTLISPPGLDGFDIFFP